MANKFKIADLAGFNDLGQWTFKTNDYAIVERTINDSVVTHKIDPVNMISQKFERITDNSNSAILSANVLSYLKITSSSQNYTFDASIYQCNESFPYFREMTLVIDRTIDSYQDDFYITFSNIGKVFPKTSENADYICKANQLNLYKISEFCPTLFVVDGWSLSVDTTGIIFPDQSEIMVYFTRTSSPTTWEKEPAQFSESGNLSGFNSKNDAVNVKFPSNVSSIAQGAFENCTNLQTVEMYNGIKEIKDNAFKGCTHLNSITTDRSTLTTIGSNAFNGCTSLSHIIIPNSITSIESDSFADCTSLTSVSVGQYVCNSHLSNTFQDAWNSITEVEILNGTTTITQEAFSNCSNLTNVLIANSVSRIENNAFTATNLENITTPTSIQYIGRSCFENCTNLKRVSLNDGIIEIENGAFSYCRSLTSINIPTTISAIAPNIFIECNNLSNISIPSNIKKIGYMAFGLCRSLENISIPGTTEEIEIHAFERCEKLSNILLNDGIKTIGNNAFYKCIPEQIDIPASITNIGQNAFYTNTLTNITIPQYVCNSNISSIFNQQIITDATIKPGVMTLGNTFEDVESLSNISIPQSLTTIGNRSFANCINLSSIDTQNVTTIDNEAFMSCTGLTSINIPNVTTIGNDAFNSCIGIVSVYIPDSITYIGPSAFYNCTGISSLEIGQGLNDIGIDAFRSCTGISSILVSGNNQYYKSTEQNHLLVTKSTNKIVRGSNVPECIIPDNIEIIGRYAFDNCNNITAILDLTSNSLYEIEEGAFDGCSAMEYIGLYYATHDIVIGNNAFANMLVHPLFFVWNNIISVGAEMLKNNISMQTSTIGSGLSAISDRMYQNDITMDTVVIGENVNYIGDQAFDGCSSLTSINFKGDKPDLGSGCFDGVDPDRCVIHANPYANWEGVTIPGRWAEANNMSIDYDNDYIIQFFGNDQHVLTAVNLNGYTKVKIPDSFTSIADNVLNGNYHSDFQKVTDLEIPSSILSIGQNAFSDAHSLTNIVLNEGLKHIGAGAFAINGAVQIKIPSTVEYIGQLAFYSSISAKVINIPRNVSTIGDRAFKAMHSLLSVVFESNNAITNFAYNAFEDCDNIQYVQANDQILNRHIFNILFSNNNIQHIDFVEGVLSIPAYFADNLNKNALSTIGLPNTLKVIDEYAFENCSLTSVIIPSNVNYIGSHAFYHNINLNYEKSPNNIILVQNKTTAAAKALFGANSAIESYKIINGTIVGSLG